MKAFQSALFLLLLLQGVKSQETGSCAQPSPMCCEGQNDECYRGCYCDEACLQRNECCPDYTQTCPPPTELPYSSTTTKPTTTPRPNTPSTTTPTTPSTTTSNQPQNNLCPHRTQRPHSNCQQPQQEEPPCTSLYSLLEKYFSSIITIVQSFRNY
ncbi:vitronectin [Triplophysa rosa]|uniref:Mucin-5AC-like n=1 Tax=Triplophysa rosa TaxID=992332 RepID=A0A9W7T5V9_TRIRA|nr:vitronectin [Triplophysa rosa]KAI7790493.1 putative mucin-5AC-like [Triplophysa rosa]